MTHLLKYRTSHILALITKDSLTCRLSSSFQNDFSPDEQNLIVEALNKISRNKLKQYSIGDDESKSLIMFKQENGNLKHVNDLLNVKGFTAELCKRLCTNIIEHNNNFKQKKKVNFTTPVVAPSEIKRIATVVGFTVTGAYYTWTMASINDYKLLDWDTKPMPLPEGIKSSGLHDIQLLDVAHNIYQSLPGADAYVFQDHSPRISSKTAVNMVVSLEILKLHSMLLTLLNGLDRGEGLFDKVYYQKKFLQALLFDKLVGDEEVTSTGTLQELFEMEYNQNKLNYTPLQIGNGFMETFRTLPNVEKECLARTLLFTMSFVDINIFQNPSSLKKVSNRKFKKKKEAK